MDTSVKCYCISLRDNNEGRFNCQKEFDRIGLSVEFIIVDKSNISGAHGCFTSHIKALNKGLKSGSEYIMVFEDDVYFSYSDRLIWEKIFSFLNVPNSKLLWCFCLGYLTGSRSETITKDIISLDRCYCAHAYIVPRQTALQLVQMVWEGKPYDVQWADVIQIFYAPFSMIAFQRDHKSSISTDVGKYILNSIGFRNVARLCEFRANFPF